MSVQFPKPLPCPSGSVHTCAPRVSLRWQQGQSRGFSEPPLGCFGAVLHAQRQAWDHWAGLLGATECSIKQSSSRPSNIDLAEETGPGRLSD